MRRAAKRDYAEAEVIAALQDMKASVYRLDQPLDILIGYRGRTVIAEIKTGKGKLNENQIKFIESWNGGDIPILRNSQDAINLITTWEQRWA